MAEETNSASKIQELQGSEQILQSFMMQRQNAQVELNEIVNALAELKKTDDEVYKIIEGMMLRSDKSTLVKELEEKKKAVELKITALEKQEKILDERAQKLRRELTASRTK